MMRRELAALGRTAAQFQNTSYWRHDKDDVGDAGTCERAPRSRSGRKLRRTVAYWNDYGLKTQGKREGEGERLPAEPAPVVGPRDDCELSGGDVGLDDDVGPSTCGPNLEIACTEARDEVNDCASGDEQKLDEDSRKPVDDLKRRASSEDVVSTAKKKKRRKLTVLRRMKPRGATRVRLRKEAAAEDASGYSETNAVGIRALVEGQRKITAFTVEDGVSITMMCDAILAGDGAGDGK